VRYEFDAEVWLYPGDAAWHFVSLPIEVADGLRKMGPPARGWRSMRVRVSVGETSWRTSVFPHAESGSFVLPLKAEVRRHEAIEAGQSRRFAVELEL
jgi:hypothetical protein